MSLQSLGAPKFSKRNRSVSTSDPSAITKQKPTSRKVPRRSTEPVEYTPSENNISNPLALYALLELDEENIGAELVDFFAGSPPSLRLVIFCIMSEIQKTGDPTLLFRGGGNRIRFVSTMIRHSGKIYLRETITEILNLISTEKSYEMDSYLVSSDDEIADNIENLKELSLDTLALIQNSLHKLPRFLVTILEVLYNETKKKFGEYATAAVSGLFLLRFIMPALAMPTSIGIPVPEVVKKVPMTLKTSTSQEFISQHYHAPVDLTIQVLKLAETPIAPAKILKCVTISRDARRQAKEKIENVFFSQPKGIEEMLLRFMSGREEQQIDFMFEATRQEHVLLSKEFQFSRTHWIEHFATWSIIQFDIIDYRASERFFLFLENKFVSTPKNFKEYSMCEIFVEHKDLGKFEYFRMERSLLEVMTMNRLNESLVAFADSGWEDFIASAVVRKLDNTKWGVFKIILVSSHPVARGTTRSLSNARLDKSPRAHIATPADDSPPDGSAPNKVDESNEAEKIEEKQEIPELDDAITGNTVIETCNSDLNCDDEHDSPDSQIYSDNDSLDSLASPERDQHFCSPRRTLSPERRILSPHTKIESNEWLKLDLTNNIQEENAKSHVPPKLSRERTEVKTKVRMRRSDFGGTVKSNSSNKSSRQKSLPQSLPEIPSLDNTDTPCLDNQQTILELKNAKEKEILAKAENLCKAIEEMMSEVANDQ